VNVYSKCVTAYEHHAMRRAEQADRGPFAWGLEWLRQRGPQVEDTGRSARDEARELSRRIVVDSDRFFAYHTPAAFQLTGPILQFASPIASPWPENNTVWARWYPARRANGRAVLVLPHWNAHASGYAPLCWLLNRFGLSALVLELPNRGLLQPPHAHPSADSRPEEDSRA
jgi:hypothetical protein